MLFFCCSNTFPESNLTVPWLVPSGRPNGNPIRRKDCMTMVELPLQETPPVNAGYCVLCDQEKQYAGHDCLAESLAQKEHSGPSAAAQTSNVFWEWCFCSPSWLRGAEEGALRANTSSSFTCHRGMRSSMMSEESHTRFSKETQSMWQASEWWGQVTTHAASVSADLHTGKSQLREV